MPHQQGQQNGKRFFAPTVSDKDRILLQTKYEKVYLGRHREAFKPDVPSDAMYISEPFGRTITNTSADLLFGEPVGIVPDSDDEAGKTFLDEFKDVNPFIQRMLWEASVTQSFSGSSIIEMTFEEGDDTPKPLFHDPRHWFPTVDAMGNVISHTLCFVINVGEAEFVWKRVHTKGFVENMLFPVGSDGFKSGSRLLIDPSNLGERIPMSTIGVDISDEPQPTGVEDDFLVHQVPNMSLPGTIHGMSDYTGLATLMSALNALTSFSYMVVEKHSDPLIEIPEQSVDEENEAELADAFNNGDARAIEVNAEEKGTTRYVTWDAKLDALFTSRTNTLMSLATYSEMAPGLIGLEDSNLPESGKALRMRFARTLRKIQRKQRHWEEAIMWILSTSQKMLGQEPSSYSIVFSDGLPEDELAFLENLLIEKDLGVKSNETIIREALAQQGFTEEMIEAEIIRINEATAVRRGAEVGVPDIFERSVEVSTDGTEAQ